MLKPNLHSILLATLLTATTAFAQLTTPIRLVVPFAAGGPTDVAARIIAPKLGEAYKRPVIIDNKVGATGAIERQARRELQYLNRAYTKHGA